MSDDAPQNDFPDYTRFDDDFQKTKNAKIWKLSCIGSWNEMKNVVDILNILDGHSLEFEEKT